MNRKIQVDDLARYVSAADDLAEAVKESIKNDDGVMTQEIILALTEYASAAEAISDVTNTLQHNKFKLN